MLQAAFADDFDVVHAPDDMDADMHDLFLLFSSAPDSDVMSETHADALGCSTFQPGSPSPQRCSPDAHYASGMGSTPTCGLTAFKIKQEPHEQSAITVIDAFDSSRACTSSSGGSPLATTTAVTSCDGSPIHAPSPSLFGGFHDGHAFVPPTDTTATTAASDPLPSSCCDVHLATVGSSLLPAAAVAAAIACPSSPAAMAAAAAAAAAAVAAAMSECKPECDGGGDAAAPTLSESTDAPYDIIQGKASSARLFGRTTSLKKPPLSHSTIEKHRRDRINHLIEELGEMVPALHSRYRGGDGSDLTGLKRPKHAVLADVVIRYKQLQAENESLRRQLALASLKAASAPPPGSTSRAAQPMATVTTASLHAPSQQCSSPALPPAVPSIAAEPAAATAAAASGTASDHSPMPTLPSPATPEIAVSPAMSAPASPPCGPAGVNAPSPAATTAAAVSSLLSRAAAGASSVQLQAALKLPIVKVATAAAAAAAASPPPLSGFVPVTALGPNPAAAAGGLYSLYTTAAAATATAATNGISVLPAVVPSAAAAITEALRSTPAADAAVAVRAVQSTPECAVSPATSPAAAATTGADASPVTACEPSSDGADSSSTVVHACRGAASAVKSQRAAAAPPPPSRRICAPSTPASPTTSSPFIRSAAAAPAPPLTAATAASSWLVRVVCPPRRDLLPAACGALADAGVGLRSARVTSAPGGRIALELEVSCEEGVLPRGMQVGHIQAAIHAALQSSGGSDAPDGEVVGDDGDALMAPPPPVGRISGKKRTRL